MSLIPSISLYDTACKITASDSMLTYDEEASLVKAWSLIQMSNINLNGREYDTDEAEFLIETDGWTLEQASCFVFYNLIVQHQNIHYLTWFIDLHRILPFVRFLVTKMVFTNTPSTTHGTGLIVMVDHNNRKGIEAFLKYEYLFDIHELMIILNHVLFLSPVQNPLLLQCMVSTNFFARADPLVRKLLYHCCCIGGHYDYWKLLYDFREEDWWTIEECRAECENICTDFQRAVLLNKAKRTGQADKIDDNFNTISTYYDVMEVTEYSMDILPQSSLLERRSLFVLNVKVLLQERVKLYRSLELCTFDSIVYTSLDYFTGPELEVKILPYPCFVNTCKDQKQKLCFRVSRNNYPSNKTIHKFMHKYFYSRFSA